MSDRPVTVLTLPDVGIADGRSALRRLVEVAADRGAGSAHRGDDGSARTWLVLGELDAADGDVQQSVVDHDLLGRAAVRLAIDKVVCVGQSRAVRAAHQGAVMEGSWGDEALLVDDTTALVQRWGGATGDVPGAGDVIAVLGAVDTDRLLAALGERDLVVSPI
ncbi:MAG: UDP-N-acetylmuramoyl-tripeptide--D-alanyl-D-alanine ligase [Gordonia sp. (in: high G+C Gram-positive bacteria)]|uniref:UDP-N-acetylmuramoyl-tripeptide--D-alanyl-D- alanine ligase n=1 Tax=Gordonia sp. (in: high G+C Gram-positive bacteria) TaxID=84139 RepID=UPI0039E40069